MTQSAHYSETSSLASLPTLSAKARARSDALQKLVNDLKLHNGLDPDGDERMVAVFELLLHEGDSQLSIDESDYLQSLDMPPALVASTCEGR